MSGTEFDIIITGAGPVGLGLALLLVARGADPSRITLIDARTLDAASADPRSIALSHGSRQILEDIGGWPIAHDPIEEIHVSRRGHFGRTLIRSSEYNLPALGYVARYGALVTALAHRVRQAGIGVLRPAQVSSWTESEKGVEISLNDGTLLTGLLLVQAEGSLSSSQDGRLVYRDYAQTALIAQVTATRLQRQRAYERFTDEGPLALLPQEGGYAMVWCVHPDTASRLKGMSDEAFLQALQHAFGTRVGRFTSASARVAYPLGLNANPAATQRTVAIGNAAQTLHPVAGQGLNLGMRDAAVLARILARDVAPSSLATFLQQRKVDRGTTIRVTDALARLFAASPEGAPLQTLLGLSLALVDLVSPARRLLAEHMMFGQRP